MRYVTAAEHAGGHTLVVTFDDGAKLLVDMGPYLDGEVFEPLRDIEVFRAFRVDPELDTVVWPTGADVAPEFLLAIGRPILADCPARH
jgi:hypothetical protein